MKKILIYSVSGLLFLSAFFIFLIPSFLSSLAGKNFLVRQIAKKAEAKIEIQEISFSWMSGQKIQGFQMEKKGELLLDFESLALETPFWNLILRSGSIKATLVKPQISLHSKVISPYKSPKVSETASSLLSKKKTKPIWSNFAGNLKIEEGSLNLKQGGINLLRLENVDFNFDFPKSGLVSTLQTMGKTYYDQFEGSFRVDGSVSTQKEIIELETVKTYSINGQANFNEFPVGGIDALCTLFAPEFRGLFIEALGDRLNLHMNFSNSDLALQLKSPRMTLSFLSDYEKGLIQLKNPLLMTWDIRPFVMQAFINELPILSRGNSYLELEISTLSLLYKNKIFDFKNLAATGSAFLSRGAFTLKKSNESLLLDNLNLSFQTSKLQEYLNVSLQNNFRYGAFPETKIEGKITTLNLSSFPEFDLSVRNFPTLFAEDLLQRENSFQNFIGSNFDLIAKRFQEGDKNKLFISSSSPSFNLSSMHFEIENNLTLLSQASFTYTLTPKLFDQIDQSVTFDGVIESLEIPSHAWKKSRLKASIKGDDFILKDTFGLGRLQVPAFSCQLSGMLNQLNTNITTQIDFAPNTWGLSLMGSSLALKASGNVDITQEFEISPLQIQLDGKKLKATIDGAIEKQAFILKKPLGVDLLIDPDQINPILSKEVNLPLLAERTPIKLEIAPGTFPLAKHELSMLDIKILSSIPLLKMTAPESGYPFLFENVQMRLDLSKQKSSQFSFDADAKKDEGKKGSIELTLLGADLQNPNQVEVRFHSLSSVIADALFQMRGTLPPTIGQTIDLEFIMEKKQQSQDLDIVINSEKLSLEGAFTVSDRLELRSNKRPLKIRWSMTEAGYQALQHLRNNHSVETHFEIQDQAIVRLDIAPLNLPIKPQSGILPKAEFNLYQADFGALARISSLILKQTQMSKVSELQRFDLNLRKKPENGPLTFKAEGVIISKESKGKSGQIKGEGKLENFLSKDGEIDLQDVTANIEMNLSHVPSVLIDVISKTRDATGLPPSAILGDSVSASLDVNIQQDSGALKIDLNASACRAKLDGIVGNGILYLKEPLRATMIITPNMNQRLAKSAGMMITSMKSPVTLLVHPDGFSVPLKNLGLEGANVSYGVIDLGQLTSSNVGSTSDVSSIFRMKEGQKNISIWFAPMEFKIKQGLMYVDRTEILYNRAYQVALWGDIDFNRRYVDMILGLTAQSLRAAIGITDIPSRYVLKVPIRGPFGDVKVDKGAATSKIALILGKRLAPQAGIWGNVLEALGRMADDQSDVPPPKPPFPWQNVTNMQERLTPRSSLDKLSKKKAKTIYKDLKKILKDP